MLGLIKQLFGKGFSLLRQSRDELNKLTKQVKQILPYFKPDSSQIIEYSAAAGVAFGSSYFNLRLPYLWQEVYSSLSQNETSLNAEIDTHETLQVVLMIVVANTLASNIIDSIRFPLLGVISNGVADKLTLNVTNALAQPEIDAENTMAIQAELEQASNSLNTFGQAIIGNLLPWSLQAFATEYVLLNRYGYEYLLFSIGYVTALSSLTLASGSALKHVEEEYEDVRKLFNTITLELNAHKNEMNLYGVTQRQLDLQKRLQQEKHSLYKRKQLYGMLCPILQQISNVLYLAVNYGYFLKANRSTNEFILFVSFPQNFVGAVNSISFMFNHFRFMQAQLSNLLDKLETNLAKIKATKYENVDVLIDISNTESKNLIDNLQSSSLKLLKHLQQFQPKQSNNTFNPSITIKNLSFSFPNKDVFVNTNLELSNEGLITLVGHNGAGKSTLTKLLFNTLKPHMGHIYINGNQLSTIEISEKISVAPQSAKYFEGSLLYNLLFLNPHASPEKIENLAIKFGVKHLLDNIQNQNFSGGELQLIGIMRTLLKNQADIFIFDEPTSALDPQKRKILMNVLKGLSKEKIIILIIHDEQLVANYSDTVIFLHDKKLLKSTHAELLQHNLNYQSYWASVKSEQDKNYLIQLDNDSTKNLPNLNQVSSLRNRQA